MNEITIVTKSKPLPQQIADEAKAVFELSFNIDMFRFYETDGVDPRSHVLWNQQLHTKSEAAADTFAANPCKDTYQRLCLALSWNVNGIHDTKPCVVPYTEISVGLAEAFTDGYEVPMQNKLLGSMRHWKRYAPAVLNVCTKPLRLMKKRIVAPRKVKLEVLGKTSPVTRKNPYPLHVQTQALQTLCARLKEESKQFKLVQQSIYGLREWRIHFTHPEQSIAIVLFHKCGNKLEAYIL